MIKNRITFSVINNLIVVGIFAILAINLSAANEHQGHAESMLLSAKDMLTHGEKGHINMLVDNAKKMIMHAQMTIENLPTGSHSDMAKEYIEKGIEAAAEAIDHGNKGHKGMAVDSAREALAHISEGREHVVKS